MFDCFYLYNTSSVSDYELYNNLCYGYSGWYAEIQNSNYANASMLNSETRNDTTASGNLDSDPMVYNSTANQLWPLPSSPLINNGYTLPAPYNELLNPNNTDFTTTPPIVNTVTQSGYIGAYALP
jgi:hypothetical protein